MCRKLRPSEKQHEHWLDAAKEKYDSKLVEDIKIILRVFVLYIPLPLFWGLFKQQVCRHSGDLNDEQVHFLNVKSHQAPKVNVIGRFNRLYLTLTTLFEN